MQAHPVTGLRLPALFPLRNALAATITATAIVVFVATRPAVPGPGGAATEMPAATVATINAIDAEVIAPAYLGSAPTTLHNPARIEAPAGSHVRLTVHADASTLTLDQMGNNRSLAMTSPGIFMAEIVVDSDGFVALEPVLTDGRTGPRRLIGVTAVADEAPTVRITAPGHDEKLLNGHHTIDVAIEAADDHALASLQLKYVRVSGSGERFTFTEGQVPLVVTRTDARHWKAHVSWCLDSLALDAGDMVVYRAVAADGHPGGTPTESDAFIAEVLAPGGIAAAGFAVDPEVERYATQRADGNPPQVGAPARSQSRIEHRGLRR